MKEETCYRAMEIIRRRNVALENQEDLNNLLSECKAQGKESISFRRLDEITVINLTQREFQVLLDYERKVIEDCDKELAEL